MSHLRFFLAPLLFALSFARVFAIDDSSVWGSPDRRSFIISTDPDGGGNGRTITLLDAKLSKIVFSHATAQRYTLASWSPGSNHCVIADAPDNGNVNAWLFIHDSNGRWNAKTVDLFGRLSEEWKRADHGPSVFRPAILRIEWRTETVVCFHTFCNMGPYDITVNAEKPDSAPRIAKAAQDTAAKP